MPSYKLTYFDGKGKAEIIRYLFALSATKYEDHRIEQGKWQEYKKNIEFGQLPVIYIDGTEYAQSHAAYRYLASQFGFYGRNDKDRLLIDVVCETIDDIWPGIYKIFQAEESKKAEIREKLKEDVLKHTANMEKLLKKNKGGAGWFIGDSMTLADVMAFNMVNDILPFALQLKGEFDLKDDHKLLKAFLGRFKSNAKIADWMKKRPQTAF